MIELSTEGCWKRYQKKVVLVAMPGVQFCCLDKLDGKVVCEVLPDRGFPEPQVF